MLSDAAVKPVFPEGARRSGDGAACSLEPAGRDGGARLDVRLSAAGTANAVRRHEADRRRDTAAHVVRAVHSVGDAAYSWSSIEAPGVRRAEVRARVGGRLLSVWIWGPAADAEALAVSVAESVAERVREYG
ncbi:hypothetical protein [Spirillospora sp. NPDC029432]|uniref:hypothetical protein n=1 Tax=Spirillospora sp. NPDC029432 TaxID=3154599 RepID=UPI0034512ED7